MQPHLFYQKTNKVLENFSTKMAQKKMTIKEEDSHALKVAYFSELDSLPY